MAKPLTFNQYNMSSSLIALNQKKIQITIPNYFNKLKLLLYDELSIFYN